MNKFYLFLGTVTVVVVCSYFGIKKLRSIPPVKSLEYASVTPALSSTQPVENCQNKKTCLIIYVAPWCGSCHMFIQNHLADVTTKLQQKEMGPLIVVGADTPEKNDEQAKKLGAIAATDPDGEFMKKNKIEYFPFFIVTNSGHVTHHGPNALDWLNQNMNDRSTH